MSEDIVIPDKPAFKAAEVCELLRVPAYVLRSWENEFRDLGVSKTVSGPRVYRREDVARALAFAGVWSGNREPRRLKTP